ncbi:MAG: enoyl-CoA hydratase/isomerase family protein [Desulfarculaceae bacterium]|nr:enoyl-CoA hydratase/isomerase family protein [Desulfarculaceae bacterium]MCF8071695.1 enoyl-CoA hydratase/isomerase family protein [Desulfarculaceae bacterium]MCF8102458.1 enoyl-CoA hydratase/isomerase family protein [Desulfarculaceae bacterium]MCF8116800.1 enoyl-CoA hydratase/isomerase family protein [Desulfarculaceae bacterium]
MKTDYKTVKIELVDGVAILSMDNPPVNQMSEHFILELKEASLAALADPEVKALVITGTGKNFMAGADVTQLLPVTDKAPFVEKLMEVHRWFNALEQDPTPVVAAINGNCLGGGMELALACNYRVAASGVSVGLPEVKLGLLPGSAGTQRMPRLIGLPDALDLITTGKFIKAEKGFSLGFIDEVAPADQLIDTALAGAKKFLSRELDIRTRMASRRFDRLPSASEKEHLLNYVKMETAKKAKGYVAPFKIIEAMEKGLSMDFEADIALEAELFGDCLVSHVAKNLIGIFLNERAAGRLPRIEGLTPAKIKKVGMLGGGVMGSSIVHLLLSHGFEAVLWEINQEALDKAVGAVKKTFAYKLKTKKLKPDQLESLMTEKLTTATDLAAMADCDLIIEAVVENMEVKQDIWKKLEGICRPEVVFGTNTSALPITDMATVLADPGRMIGLHFFNPAERMPLLEIICAEQTSDQTLASSVAFGRAIRKVPVVVNDGPGFYVSRQLGGLMGGSVFLVADGVNSMAIEKAMRSFGMPMGPATLADLTGIDINYHVNQTFAKRLGPRYDVHPLTEAIFQLGDYGRKTGRGYFDYTGPEPMPNQRLQKVVDDYLAANKVQPKEMSQQEIIDAMLALAINEAALMMEQGICDRPADMDLAMIYGTGFPPYRGGILRYADQWGLPNVLAKLEELEAAYGPRFAPAGLIKKMTADNQTFYQM